MSSHHRPLLFTNLRKALGSLYNIPGCQHIPHHEAHEFLIQLQSRNVRRKIQSAHQRHCDQNGGGAFAPPTDVQLGSSWLAALTLLCEYQNHEPVYTEIERLFAVQSLLHRLRRVKLVEAVDLEMEVSDFAHMNAQNVQAPYLSYIGTINPHLEVVLSTTEQHDEEHIKGEMTVLTLAGLLYLESCATRIRTPLLQTLAHAVVTATFRIYCLNSSASLVNLLHKVVQTASQKLPANLPASVFTMMLCLSVLPDAILGHPGGARGRLSADGRYFRQLGSELRDSKPLEEILHSFANTPQASVLILDLLSNWASLLPLSMTLLQSILPVLQMQLQSGQGQSNALQLLLNIYEGAAWSMDQVLSSLIGLSDTKFDYRNKKKTSRAKKRHQEVVAKNSNDALIENAQKELIHRGNVACVVTAHCWEALDGHVNAALAQAGSQAQIEGEGPIGVMSACANACLPHVLKHPSTANGLLLVQHISEGLKHMCASSNRSVRMLALEPLYTLHTTMLDVVRERGGLQSNLETVVVEALYVCSMGLAGSCGYPLGYFDKLDLISDHDLEVERNDIRDLLRSVGGSGEGGSTVNTGSTRRPPQISVSLLHRLVQSCSDATGSATIHRMELSETAIHAFSSLAKPINHLAKCCQQYSPTGLEYQILQMALKVLSESNQLVVKMFRDSPQDANVTVLLPISRIVNIANASLSPFLSAIASANDQQWSSMLSDVLTNIVQGSIFSLEQIPELSAPSVVPPSMYNIRGTMRLPGGEDHVGCLSLMRATSEGEPLVHFLVKAISPCLSRLAKLHHTLKKLEVDRGMLVFHGSGVCPQTRRILVGTLCLLEKSSNGLLGASTILSELFHGPIGSILALKDRRSFGEAELYNIVEAVLDLASFAPEMVASLFASPSDRSYSLCLEVLTNVCVSGYQRYATSSEAALQWNRIRAALYLLMKKSVVSDLSVAATAIIGACVTAECEAIHRHCDPSVAHQGILFSEEVISSETIPSGVFVVTVTEALRIAARNTNASAAANCIQALSLSSSPVLATILLPCGAHGFSDPRPTLCEAWLLAMIELVGSQCNHPARETLLLDTFSAVVLLLFYPSMGLTEADRMHDPGMCLDGPHGLTIILFLSSFFKLGPNALKSASLRLLSAMPIDVDSLQHFPANAEAHGCAILGAALFRACQGALPPWALELVPELFMSLFAALGSDPAMFGVVTTLSLEAKLSKTHGPRGSVQPGDPLVGSSLYRASSRTKVQFVTETQELSAKGGGESWRRVKVLVKSLCGGKKAGSDFNQKPSLTRWEFERV